MNKSRIGITGAEGFLGRHLSGCAAVAADMELVSCRREYFDESEKMAGFLASCDKVVHLAAISRHEDGEHLYDVNVALTRALSENCRSLSRAPKIFLASTTHLHKGLPYHRSKLESQVILERSGVPCLTMLMPNIFGPYSRPFYNSAVSTFCFLAACGRQPEKIDDVFLELIYVGTLCRNIMELIRRDPEEKVVTFPAEHRVALPELWEKLCCFKRGMLPEKDSIFDLQLWTTFQSYAGTVSGGVQRL